MQHRLDERTYLDIGNQVRQGVLQSYRPDSCIATARATLILLKQLNVNAYATPVFCMITNRPLWEYADRAGRYPEVGSPEYPEGGYGIGVGLGQSETTEDGHKTWGGHLVVIAERKWLLDYSIDQARRPEHGLDFGPFVGPITEEWLRNRDRIAVFQRGDVRLHYAHKVGPEARRYQMSPDWTGDNAISVTLTRTTDRTIERATRRRLIR